MGKAPNFNPSTIYVLSEGKHPDLLTVGLCVIVSKVWQFRRSSTG